jgi:hypothetical protein
MTEQRPPRPGRRTLLFAAWAGVGVIGAFGTAALLTIGVLLVVAAGVLAGILVWRTRDEWVPLLGVGLGAAVPVGYLGWINRDGPGTVCRGIADGVSCADEWAPWPFYVVALTLAVASVAVFLYLDRLGPRRRPAPHGVAG